MLRRVSAFRSFACVATRHSRMLTRCSAFFLDASLISMRASSPILEEILAGLTEPSGIPAR